MDPEFIFYDEPSAGLDPIVAAGIDELIRKMQETFKLTSVVVTHEMESVKLIADSVCMLKGGRAVVGRDARRARADPTTHMSSSSLPAGPMTTNLENAAYAKALTGLE